MSDIGHKHSKTPTGRRGTRVFWAGLGWVMMICAPLVGAIPGPGFILVFPIGLALVLKNSLLAKRQYAKFAKRFPEYGLWLNYAMRRKRYKKAPPTPDLWGDIMHMFRRDDTDRKLD